MSCLRCFSGNRRRRRFAEIETIVRAELGERAAMLLATMERAPVATASVGQVHRAELPDGTPVAVKVLHPGVEQAIRADFKTAQVAKAMAGLIAPGVEVKEVIAEARERFLEECDSTLERRRQLRFAELYRGHPSIGIPRVFEEFCARLVLTTQWRGGLRLEDFARTATQDARDRVARLSRAVREDRREGIMAALRGLEARPPEDDKAFETTRRLLRGFFQPTLESGPGPMRGDVTFEVRQLVADKLAVLKIRLPGRLLFLFRIRFGLYSVLARIGAVQDWRALEERFTLEVLASSGEAAGR